MAFHIDYDSAGRPDYTEQANGGLQAKNNQVIFVP